MLINISEQKKSGPKTTFNLNSFKMTYSITSSILLSETAVILQSFENP
jgi:hypothetical protein